MLLLLLLLLLYVFDHFIYAWARSAPQIVALAAAGGTATFSAAAASVPGSDATSQNDKPDMYQQH